MADTVQIPQAGDSLLLLLHGPLPEGDASSALPTQEGLSLNQEEFSLEARSPLPCCTIWLQSKRSSLYQTPGPPLSLNRCWISCFSGHEDFLSKILFLLLKAQIREGTTYPWSNNRICKCPEEPENSYSRSCRRKLEEDRVCVLKPIQREKDRCTCEHELKRRV